MPHNHLLKKIYVFGCNGSQLWHAGCVFVQSGFRVHGLSRPVAYGILDPQPGIEPTSPALEGGLLTTGLPGKSHNHL